MGNKITADSTAEDTPQKTFIQFPWEIRLSRLFGLCQFEAGLVTKTQIQSMWSEFGNSSQIAYFDLMSHCLRSSLFN